MLRPLAVLAEKRALGTFALHAIPPPNMDRGPTCIEISRAQTSSYAPWATTGLPLGYRRLHKPRCKLQLLASTSTNFKVSEVDGALRARLADLGLARRHFFLQGLATPAEFACLFRLSEVLQCSLKRNGPMRRTDVIMPTTVGVVGTVSYMVLAPRRSICSQGALALGQSCWIQRPPSKWVGRGAPKPLGVANCFSPEFKEPVALRTP